MDTKEVWLRMGLDQPWEREKNDEAFWSWLHQMQEDGVYVSVEADETRVRVTID